MNPEQKPCIITRRQFLKTMATAFGGVTLAACGAIGNSSSSSPSGITAPAVSNISTNVTNLTLWYWDDAINPVIDAFHKKQQNIRVKFEKLGQDDMHQKLLTSLAAGTGAPDLVGIEIAYVGAFVERRGLVDLLSTPFDGGQYKADMVDYKWQQGSSSDGRLICMPWDTAPAGFWYRTDLFQQAGLETDPEKVQARLSTWDDFFQLGEDLKKKLPSTVLISDAFYELLTAMIEQKGHGWFTGNKLQFDKALQPLQRTIEGRKRGIDVNLGWFTPEWATGMKNNAFASMLISCWMQGVLIREQPQTVGKWHVVRTPEGDFNNGGQFLSISEQSQQKEAAWEFLKFACCTAEGQNILFKTFGAYPAYKPAWTDPIYEQPIDFFGGQKVYKIWGDIAASIPGQVVNPNDRLASDIIQAEILKVANENKDPTQAIKDATEEAKRRIKGIEV